MSGVEGKSHLPQEVPGSGKKLSEVHKFTIQSEGHLPLEAKPD